MDVIKAHSIADLCSIKLERKQDKLRIKNAETKTTLQPKLCMNCGIFHQYILNYGCCHNIDMQLNGNKCAYVPVVKGFTRFGKEIKYYSNVVLLKDEIF